MRFRRSCSIVRHSLGELILSAAVLGLIGCGSEYASRNIPAQPTDVIAEAPVSPASVGPAEALQSPAKSAPDGSGDKAKDKPLSAPTEDHL